MKVKNESEVAQLCPTLSDQWNAAYQAPLPMGFSRHKYWNGLPMPSPIEQFRQVNNCLQNGLSVTYQDVFSDMLRGLSFRVFAH